MDGMSANSEDGNLRPTTADIGGAQLHPKAPLPPQTVNSDTGLDEFTCPVCSKVFSGSVASGGLKSNFRRHLRTHADPNDVAARPYECPQCQLRFTTSSNLKRHIKTCAPTILEGVVAGFSRTGGGGQTGKTRRDVSATRESVRAAVSVIRSRHHMGDGDDTMDGCVSEDGIDIGAATSVGSFLPHRGYVRGGGGGHKRSRMDAPDYDGRGEDEGYRPVDSRLNHAPSLLSLNQLSGAAGGGRGGFEVVDQGAGIRGAFGIVMPTQMSYSPHLLPHQPPTTPINGLATPHPTSEPTVVPLSPLALGGTSLQAAIEERNPTTTSNSQSRFRFGLPFELSTAPRNDGVASSSTAALTSASLFNCPFCDKQFVWRNSMTQHITLHHRSVKESFVCGLCQASLSSRTKLRRHQRYHCPFIGTNGGMEQDYGGVGDDNDDDEEPNTMVDGRSSVSRVQVTEVRTYAPLLPPLTVAGWAEAVEELSGFTLSHTHTVDGNNAGASSTYKQGIEHDNEIGSIEDEGQISTSTSAMFMGNRTQSDGFNSTHHASPASYTVRQFPNPDFGIKIEDDTNTKSGSYQQAVPSSESDGSGGMGSRVMSSGFKSTNILVTGAPESTLPPPPKRGAQDLSCSLCAKVFVEKRYLKAHMVRCAARQQKKQYQQGTSTSISTAISAIPDTNPASVDATGDITTPAVTNKKAATTAAPFGAVVEDHAVPLCRPVAAADGDGTVSSDAAQATTSPNLDVTIDPTYSI